ncbi:MAG: DUF3784 domain-containing protein [Candidatus Methanoplasma sp.]|nr:DUF3784 domain-containing protein [Candidatus Methanoplasma sp.]
MVEGRLRGALIMGVSWATASVASFCFLLDKQVTLVFCAFLTLSLIVVAIGISVYLGTTKLLAGFNTMSECEMSKYNVANITSFMGVFLVAVSYIFLIQGVLGSAGRALLLVVVGMLVIAVIYVNFNSRFKSEA